jgi:hypothetical protein
MRISTMDSVCMSLTPVFAGGDDHADTSHDQLLVGIHLRKVDSHGPKPGYAPNAAGDETLPF